MITSFIQITRPFTLLPPLLGIVSGSLAAMASMGATGKAAFTQSLLLYWPQVLVGGLMAATLNAASNVLNQVTEVEVDCVNKPDRVLPQGRMRVRTAIAFSGLLYVAALALAWWTRPTAGSHAVFWCALGAAIATIMYSVKPLYLKTRGWWANVTIAVARGCLLKVAGWACVASVADVEPWFIGLVFMLFLLGAASSKDFADLAGDRQAGIRTLPVIHGPRKTARMIAPFFVLPWLLMSAGVLLQRSSGMPILHANLPATLIFGVLLAIYGIFISSLMRKSVAVSVDGNHPAWKHMYLMMMSAQIGLVVCYVL